MIIIGKILLSLMFFLSVFGNLTGGFNDSVNYVKSIKFPLPTISVIIGMIIKLIGAISLVTNFKKNIFLPLLIAFVILVTILFNNPIQYPDKKWMFMSLLGVIGGLFICYFI